MYVWRNIEGRSYNHCCSGKAMSVTYCECLFVALSIQHAMRMRHAIVSSMACLAERYFSLLSHYNMIFGKKMLNKKCVFFSLQILPETFLTLRRIEPDMIKNVCRSAIKVPFILVRF